MDVLGTRGARFGGYLGVRRTQKVLVLSSERNRVTARSLDPTPTPLRASLKHILGKYTINVEGKLDSSIRDVLTVGTI